MPMRDITANIIHSLSLTLAFTKIEWPMGGATVSAENTPTSDWKDSIIYGGLCLDLLSFNVPVKNALIAVGDTMVRKTPLFTITVDLKYSDNISACFTLPLRQRDGVMPLSMLVYEK